jgi:transcriptional regulator with XRE-family HTH domain
MPRRRRSPSRYPAVTASQIEAMDAQAGRTLPLPVVLTLLRGDLSQEEVARTIGVARENYNKWERGKSGISETYAIRLSELTGLPAERFGGGRQSELDQIKQMLSEIQETVRELRGRLAALAPQDRQERLEAALALLEGEESLETPVRALRESLRAGRRQRRG